MPRTRTSSPAARLPKPPTHTGTILVYRLVNSSGMWAWEFMKERHARFWLGKKFYTATGVAQGRFDLAGYQVGRDQISMYKYELVVDTVKPVTPPKSDQNLATALSQLGKAKRMLRQVLQAGGTRETAKRELSEIASLCHVVLARIS